MRGSGKRLKPPASVKTSGRLRRRVVRLFAAFAVAYLLLLIPDRKMPAPAGGGKTPFAWNRGAFWSQLEQQFADARLIERSRAENQITIRFDGSRKVLDEIRRQKFPADAEIFDRLEANFFELAPLVGVWHDGLSNYVALGGEIQTEVKRQSEDWNDESPADRARLYRAVAGTRMAVEEVMLQAAPEAAFPELTIVSDEPSQTPSVVIRGLTLHSGDILVSRGGAPVSALIARGNDFPGSFSHVALLHVDEVSNQASVIESHIERGVAVSSFEEYLKDKKLRIVVLRLRSDLGPIRADPLLPHKAATTALHTARTTHIPYDFAMDWRDPRKQFCSEVVYAAYNGCGVRLWLRPTFISSPVTAAWLASVGVSNFETQEPADLEQDPQVRIVAEWRDRATLLKAHADDAVIDVMLAAAKPGVSLPHNFWLLPFARLSKAYSVILSLVGKTGPVPEGLNATQALRVKEFRAEHAAIVGRLLVLVDRFKVEKGYVPPYWELVRLAEQARVGERGPK